LTKKMTSFTKRTWNKHRGGGDNRSDGDINPPHKSKERFKGEITGTSGHVFQYHSEQRVSGKFEDTMGALKTFASTKYVLYIDYLTPIFVDLSEPTLTKPKFSGTTETITLKDKTTRDIKSHSTEKLNVQNKAK